MPSKLKLALCSGIGIVGLFALVASCNQPGGPSAPHVDFHPLLRWPWVEASASGAAGIDYGAIWCATGRRDDTLLVAAWFDAHPEGQQTGQFRSTPQASEHSHPVEFKGANSVKFDYRTEAGKPDPLGFKINGQEYDLDAGRLFLVSVGGDAPRVLQLKRDLGPDGMKVEAESIVATAKSDAEIRDFFGASDAKSE